MTAYDNITRLYSGDGEIGRRIDEQLRLTAVADDHTLSPSDVAAVDQFHVGGLEATQELAQLFSPLRGSCVLDIGSGLGGPSRYLAANYGCRVIGIDITGEYCRVAQFSAHGWGWKIKWNTVAATPASCSFPMELSMARGPSTYR
jgi:2-polyprenyl-3-methyl-5-hydroxy-6-metoxy-1,4-benzoquinol methylase